ncbi:MAG TPA: hypothetical protein VKD66_17480 [Streptosporangiaceae bacterium]|nr:hypothetical protein [Streptosporangiaceae bacterium]
MTGFPVTAAEGRGDGPDRDRVVGVDLAGEVVQAIGDQGSPVAGLSPVG